jgi:hypothetical protein
VGMGGTGGSLFTASTSLLWRETAVTLALRLWVSSWGGWSLSAGYALLANSSATFLLL